MKLLVGQRPSFARFAFPNDGRLVAPLTGEMSVQAIFGNVELSAHEPLCEGRFPVEDLFPGSPPDQFAGFAGPESVGVLDRLPIHSPVLLKAFDSRLCRELFRWFENPPLDQVRLNIIVDFHRQIRGVA